MADHAHVKSAADQAVTAAGLQCTILRVRAKIFIALISALADASAAWAESPTAQNPPVAGENKDSRMMSAELSSEIELRIERVVPMSRFHGEALLAAADPRFILVAQVRWVQKPGGLALHSQHAFAIHSPTQLGLNGWQRGDSICLLLTRTRSGEQVQWRLSALKPDAGCRGGG